MPDYKHGAYGQIAAAGSRMTDDSQSVIVYVGTAPVQSIDEYSGSVNKPIVVHNMAEARKYFGYSDDWAKYTLCEAMHVHFEMKGVGALVLINVLDPATHRASEKTTLSATPSNGVVIVSEAEEAILSTVTVKSGNTAKVKGTDYSLTYDGRKKQISIRELTTGALGSTALTIEYYAVTPEAVTSTTVIGTTDGYGTNTGLYAINQPEGERALGRLHVRRSAAHEQLHAGDAGDCRDLQRGQRLQQPQRNRVLPDGRRHGRQELPPVCARRRELPGAAA